MPSIFLTPLYLKKLQEEILADGKYAADNNFWFSKYLKENAYGSRHILMRRWIRQAQLAGLWSTQGVPTGRPEPSGEEMYQTILDIMAADTVEPEVVQEEASLMEIGIRSTNMTAQELRRRVEDRVRMKQTRNIEAIYRTLEYFFWQSLYNGGVQWPPTDDAGNTISNPPSYWNPTMGNFFPFAVPTELKQDLATLVDYNGNAATADQRKYWSDATADIFGAIDVVDQVCRHKHGFTIQRGTMIGRSSLMNHIINNTKALNFLRGDENTSARDVMTTFQLRDRFSTLFGINFTSYDNFWTYEALGGEPANYDPKIVHYLPEDRVVIIPENTSKLGELGTTYTEDRPGVWTPGLKTWIDTGSVYNGFTRVMGAKMAAWPLYDEYKWVTLKVLA